MRVAARQWRILLAFRPPCLWALYKKNLSTSSKREHRKKQTSKQINKQKKKREVKVKTAKNTPTQHWPEKPTPSQNSPPSRLSQLHSIFTSHTLFLTPPSHHPSLSFYKHVHTCQRARKARKQPHNRSHTDLRCGHFSHGASGRDPGGARLAPFTEPSPAFPPASPSPSAHTPFCQNYPT